jgi:Tfp pilus assembly major pilin PilA
MRRGFTLIEVVLIMGFIAVLAKLSIPLYRSYLIRNDLEVATEQIVQGVGRAQLLSQTGYLGSSWGFYVPGSVLYKGTTFASRDTAYDEVYPMPSTLSTSGLVEVSFSKIDGKPSATGSITLTAISGESRTVNIKITTEGIPITSSDRLVICHKPNTSNCGTKLLQENAWPGHQGHGDHLGPCTVEDGECEEAVEEDN